MVTNCISYRSHLSVSMNFNCGSHRKNSSASHHDFLCTIIISEVLYFLWTLFKCASCTCWVYLSATFCFLYNFLQVVKFFYFLLLHCGLSWRFLRVGVTRTSAWNLGFTCWRYSCIDFFAVMRVWWLAVSWACICDVLCEVPSRLWRWLQRRQSSLKAVGCESGFENWGVLGP